MKPTIPRIRRGDARAHAPGALRLTQDGAGSGTARLVVLGADAVAALVAEAVGDALERAAPVAGGQLLDRNGLARALGVSTSTVDRLVRTGLPCLLVCEARRFELPAVLEWLRARSEGNP